MDNLNTAFDVAFPPFALGNTNENEFWEKFLYTARARKIDIAYAKKLYKKSQKENEHMLTLLKKLKMQYELVALSTIPKEWLHFKRKKFNLDSYFRFMIASGEVGIAKPNIKIYQLLIEKVNLPANEILFIDDKETLLPPAQKLGIKTLLFRGQKHLEKQLEDLRDLVHPTHSSGHTAAHIRY